MHMHSCTCTGSPATLLSTSCVFDLICRYDFLSSKAEEQRDPPQLSHDVPEEAATLPPLALTWKPSGRTKIRCVFEAFFAVRRLLG